jgi:hypothetical protein
MNLFSKLHGDKQKDGSLSYDLPDGLRVQIVHIWRRGFGPDDRYSSGPSKAYGEIYQKICEEHQLLGLPCFGRGDITPQSVITEYFLGLKDVSKALEVVQIVFSTMERMVHRTRNAFNDDIFELAPKTADIVDELNRRFRENNVGYQYVQGGIEKIQQGPAPMQLKEGLVDGEPESNLRKIKEMIGGLTVTAIHDPYTTMGSLDTILKLAGMGASFSRSLRILGAAKALSNSTEKKSFVSLLKDINTERKASWEVRIYPAASKPHRRFLILDDGSIVTCGMSLNHIDKDEVLDHESCGSENAKHDCQLFEAQWKIATSV